MHVILGFNPISKCFQSPKHIIKAKDPRLALINIVVPSFSTTPPPSETQDAQLLASLITKPLHSQKQPIPSNDEVKVRTLEPTQEVIDKDFEVFYLQEDLEDLPSPSHRRLPPAQVSTNQEAANIPEGMVLEEKTPDLLALLIAHARGASPAIPVVPRPPTPTPTHASSSDAADKKRKRGKGSKGAEEGESILLTQQPPAKEPQTIRVQQKKSAASGTLKSSEGGQHPKASIWKPSFVLSSRDPVMDNATLRDPQKGKSGILSECLENALLLPKYMHEL